MINLFQPENIVSQAKEKINKEFKSLGCIGKKESAVSSYVYNVLCDACDQSEKFASVIYDFKRTLKDCLITIMKNTGNAISDIDVYRKAIQFYFPNSEINYTTTIVITGDAPTESEINKVSISEDKAMEKDNDAIEKNVKHTKENKDTKKSDQKKDDNTIQLSLF